MGFIFIQTDLLKEVALKMGRCKDMVFMFHKTSKINMKVNGMMINLMEKEYKFIQMAEFTKDNLS